jgi:hypothetical protein
MVYSSFTMEKINQQAIVNQNDKQAYLNYVVEYTIDRFETLIREEHNKKENRIFFFLNQQDITAIKDLIFQYLLTEYHISDIFDSMEKKKSFPTVTSFLETLKEKTDPTYIIKGDSNTSYTPLAIKSFYWWNRNILEKNKLLDVNSKIIWPKVLKTNENGPQDQLKK